MQNDADKLIEIFSRIFPNLPVFHFMNLHLLEMKKNMSMIALKVVGFHP